MARRLKSMMGNYLEARRDGHKYGYEIRLVEPDNYEHYYILLKPLAGVYKNQKYIMEMKTTYGLGEDVTTYPNNAPYIHFITNILHVNISPNGGSICLDILKDKDKWSPQNSFDTLIQNILLLFNEPNNASPYNGEASRIWVDCEKNYKKKKTGRMSLSESEELYLECFEPFISESRKVMLTNNFEQYAQWFPELAERSPDYKKRVEADNAELQELEEMYAKMKATKKVQQPDSQKPDVQKPDSQPDAQKPDAVKDDDQKPEPAKKNRWAKYQKS